MRALKLIVDQPRGRFTAASEQEWFDGYEFRLIRWGCAECKFFEKRVFSSRVTSEELDGYILCRFSGELVDLIEEGATCLKVPKPQLNENKRKSGRPRLHCVYRT